MLRMGELPQAWMARPTARELQDPDRYRATLVGVRSGLSRSWIHVADA
jgi:hypothetical protein